MESHFNQIKIMTLLSPKPIVAMVNAFQYSDLREPYELPEP